MPVFIYTCPSCTQAININYIVARGSLIETSGPDKCPRCECVLNELDIGNEIDYDLHEQELSKLEELHEDRKLQMLYNNHRKEK